MTILFDQGTPVPLRALLPDEGAEGRRRDFRLPA
jgi:hypothetical protein